MKKHHHIFLLIFTFVNLSASFVYGNDSLDFDYNQDLLEKPQFVQKSDISTTPQEATVAQSEEYEIGVDDVLDINIIKPEPIANTAIVAPDGTITFPYIGSVQVKGLTLSEIQDEVQKRLVGYVEYPVVSVSLRQTRSKKFVIYGQVVAPGAYPVEENMTLLHAITKAGGFITPGSTGKVKVLRPKPASRETEIIKSDITAILNGVKQNITTILPGDTIVVSVDKFYISGQVHRPGTYPVEENMTLLHAITLAGGFLDPSTTGRVKLFRQKGAKKGSEIIAFDIVAILGGTGQDINISPGDSVVVSTDKFFVYGEVMRPGMYPLEASTSALTAISMAGGFTKFGSASRVKVLRMNEEFGAYDTMKVNVNDVMSGDPKADVLLKSQDIVVVSEGVF